MFEKKINLKLYNCFQESAQSNFEQLHSYEVR